jgi:hypothetical protein
MSAAMAPAGFEAPGVPAAFFAHLDPANAVVREFTYLLCLVPPYRQAKHYLGSAAELATRLAEHGGPRGARLLQVQRSAGGDFVLTRTWPGGRPVESFFKAQRQSPRLCPRCYPATRRGVLPAAMSAAVPLVPLAEVPRPRRSIATCARAGRRWAKRFLADRADWTADEIEQDAADLQTPYYEGRRTPEGDAEQDAFGRVITAALAALRGAELARSA